jgi:hypothetical protein
VLIGSSSCVHHARFCSVVVGAAYLRAPFVVRFSTGFSVASWKQCLRTPFATMFISLSPYRLVLNPTYAGRSIDRNFDRIDRIESVYVRNPIFPLTTSIDYIPFCTRAFSVLCKLRRTLLGSSTAKPLGNWRLDTHSRCWGPKIDIKDILA